MKVKLDDSRFAVVKTRELQEVDFFAAVNCDGYTLVVRVENLGRIHCNEFEKGFRLLTFEAKMDFSTVGFLAKVAEGLAKAEVPILVFSSYFTDHLLVKEEDLERAVKALEDLGFEVSS